MEFIEVVAGRILPYVCTVFIDCVRGGIRRNKLGVGYLDSRSLVVRIKQIVVPLTVCGLIVRLHADVDSVVVCGTQRTRSDKRHTVGIDMVGTVVCDGGIVSGNFN